MLTLIFTELQPDLLELTALKKLTLRKNLLSTLPVDISKLSRLKELDLSRNEISEIPPSIGKLNKLGFLDISHNKLDSLPPTLALLDNLSVFNFEKNKLRLIPKAMHSHSGTGSATSPLLGYLKDLLKGNQVTSEMSELTAIRSVCTECGSSLLDRVRKNGEFLQSWTENVGKTSLCNCLRRLYKTNSQNMCTQSPFFQRLTMI